MGNEYTCLSYLYFFGCCYTHFDDALDQHWDSLDGPPGVLGIWGEWLFIFGEMGSTGNYFRGSREQAHIFGDLGSSVKKQKIKEKPPFCLIF